MTRRRRDPLERALEDAFAPGTFIGWRDGSDFVADLEQVRDRVTSLAEPEQAARTVQLLEIFIAGCYEKAEEVDDSGGDFGGFVGELFCDWIRARRKAGADPVQTATRLLDWMESDKYGYCSDLEEAAVAAFDRKGLMAFEQVLRDRTRGADEYEARRKVAILKTICRAKGDVAAYVAICEAQGPAEPKDCEALAEMCVKKRRWGEALAWVRRGLEQQKSGRWTESAWRLPELERELLTRLGRREEAVASAWGDYRHAPSKHSYDDLMKRVPKASRPEWHEKAMGVLETADLGARIDVLVATRELQRLGLVIDGAARDQLAELSHYTTDPAAKMLARSHPLQSGKLRIAMAWRILGAGKSKYYSVALDHLQRARQSLLREHRTAEWEALARKIRDLHKRKTGFVSQFERLGEKPTRESFLDRARKRWASDAGRGRE